jgi:hypothetical protein
MSTLMGYGGAVALLAIAAIAMVALGRRRRPARSDASRSEEPAQTDDTAATGYVPGVWMLGGAESAAPGDHHAHGHHGLDAGGSHAADAGGGTGDSGGSDGGGGD